MWQAIKTIGSLLIGGSGTPDIGSTNIMKVASGVGNFIDESLLSEQERIEFNMKRVDQYNGYMEATMAENTQRSITRRDVAIWVIRVEILSLMLYGVLASFEIAASNVWWKIAVDSPLGLLTLGVGAFFFGTHALRSAKTGK